ncbi:MAG: 50S ribosomal protein L13 [Candidatus Bathyarchaeia archaeon]|jgi:large subunit ribosomal protein L13
MSNNTVIIDAKGLVLGRMASVVAKHLLDGETVAVLNAEKAAISGTKQRIVAERKSFLAVGHPRKGPYHHRRPDRIVRNTVRGMLPRDKPKGVAALKRLRVYLGIPLDFEGKQAQTILEAKADKLTSPYITVGDLAKEIGWTPEVE